MDYRERLHQSWAKRRLPMASVLRGDPSGHGAFDAKVETTPPGPSRRLRQQVFTKLLRDLDAHGSKGMQDADVARGRVRRILGQALTAPDAPVLSEAERLHLEDQVVAEVRGLGPLEPLFADPTLSDVLINGPHDVWVDRFGRLERTNVRFDDEAHLRRLLDRLVTTHNRRLDESSPAVDVRLPDGSRLHAVIPPLSPATTVSIRRPRRVPFRLEELFETGTLTPEMGTLLSAAIQGGLNVVISGGGATGKTTLLNVLSSFIPTSERVITIEETAELRLEHPHVVALEARLPNIEGKGEVTLRSLVKHALRMRADRVIVGEVRGPEVFDMLQAMNTGHDGSLTTVHANSPRDALRRLENLVLLGGFELPSAAIRELLGAAFDLLVHVTRFPDGTRCITSLQEVVFVDGQLDTRELFRFVPDRGHGRGRHHATGIRPTFLSRLGGTGRALETVFATEEATGVEERAS